MTALLAIGILASTCLEIATDRILARDLARVLPEFATVPGDAVFGLAPRPGIRRDIRRTELQSFANKWSIELGGSETVCVSGRLRTIDRNEVAAALEDSLSKLLGGGHDTEVLAIANHPVPEGELVFPPTTWSREGPGRIRWRGYVVSASGARYPVWAAVRVPEGEPVRAVRKAIPHDVKAGDSVDIVVRMGAARLSLSALAETSGRTGDRVTFKNRESGRRFHAVVTGPGRARIGEQSDGEN
jgi:hypothetical protein